MPIGCIIRLRVHNFVVRACTRIYTAWVSALLIRHYGFSQDLNQRISKRGDPRFLLVAFVTTNPPTANSLTLSSKTIAFAIVYVSVCK